MNKIYFTFVIALLLIGCTSAQKAHEVNAIRIPIAPYLKMTCKELATEQSLLIKDAEAAGAKVDSSYSSDKTAEVVGWLILWPTLFFIEGNQEETQKLAAIKGQLDSVAEAMKINKCTSN